MDTCIFVVLPFYGRELAGDFGGETGPSPLGFLANPQLSTDLVCLYQLPFELGYHAISLSMMSYRELKLNLKSQHFPLSLAFRGVEF